MSDSPITVPAPKPVDPKPIDPKPIDPKPIDPKQARAKHYAYEGGCVRCGCTITEKTGLIRQLCSPCDLALQEMHWNTEHQLFRRTVYIPKVPHDGGPPLDWLNSNGYAEHIRKPSRPYWRSSLRAKTPPIPSLVPA